MYVKMGLLRKRNKPFKKKGLFREYAEAIITALIIALIIRAFVIQAFKIPSGSMKPTLLVGDHLLVNKFIYGTSLPFKDGKILAFKNPERGDIIVFKYPNDPSRDFIKRVIGEEGDTIEIRNKKVYVNGAVVEEKYAQYTAHSIISKDDPRRKFGPVSIPRNKLFVLGDNRDHSLDSRYWGFVDRDLIKGKALIIYWSWNGEEKFPRFARIGRLIK